MSRPKVPALRSALWHLLFALLLVACNAVLGNTTTEVIDPANTDAGSCVARTVCAPGTCGPLGDGCGGALDCRCGPGTVCNGSQCTCIKEACGASACGALGDGCGATRNCGDCASANFECSEGGSCTCEPKACGERCGWQPDGCGGEGFLVCPDCASGSVCGAGQLDVCGASGGPACVPRACVNEANGSNGAVSYCGLIAPGCGEHNLLFCGDCAAPQTCGGAGVENVCGCKPKTCEQLGVECGNDADDGCGGKANCPACPGNTTCGGGGVPGTCGCTPATCVSLGVTCGTTDNGCGTALDCGGCAGGLSCNNGTCGQSCVPTPKEKACREKCGTEPDGCGGTYECQCPSNTLCDVAAHTCGKCTPLPPSGVCGIDTCGVITEPNCQLPIDCGTCPMGRKCFENKCVCEDGAPPCSKGGAPSELAHCCTGNEECRAFGCCDPSMGNCPN